MGLKYFMGLIYKYMDKMYRYTDVWIYEYMDKIYGYLDIWLYEYMDVYYTSGVKCISRV